MTATLQPGLTMTLPVAVGLGLRVRLGRRRRRSASVPLAVPQWQWPGHFKLLVQLVTSSRPPASASAAAGWRRPPPLSWPPSQAPSPAVPVGQSLAGCQWHCGTNTGTGRCKVKLLVPWQRSLRRHTHWHWKSTDSESTVSFLSTKSVTLKFDCGAASDSSIA